MAAVPRVLVSAPGKLILFGEHAVVYTSPALAAAVSSLRTSVECPGSQPGLSVQLPRSVLPSDDTCADYSLSWDLIADLAGEVPTDPRVHDGVVASLRDRLAYLEPFVQSVLVPVAYIALCVLPRAMIDAHPALQIVVRSHGLPAGAGLGSSAAFSVALSGAMCTAAALVQGESVELEGERHLVRLTTEPRASSVVGGEDQHAQLPCERLRDLFNAWAFVAETIFHGSPSGLDNTMSVHGGALWFSRHPPTQRPLRNPRPLRVLIVNTHISRSTKDIVAGVRTRRTHAPDVYDPLIDAVAAIVRRASDYIEEGQCDGSAVASAEPAHFALEDLVRTNHLVLNAMGVGHDMLDKVCTMATQHGFAAKLTGAGGGGCAFVLLGEGEVDVERRDRLVAAMHSAYPGVTCHDAELGGVGVAVHVAHA